ncbi:hypothetical protein [Streptacidiphilus carbonis]|uniref:hypothetical protein n=1 Tax=Streptacidiphilus carbonis TaxID=105422 RepID=UPI0005AAACBB|nr:hypothetical protein [Streptacidiphilus carbonis]
MTAATEDDRARRAATPVSPRQLALFPVRTGPRVVLSYTRPDGGPLTAADFDHLTRLARPATGATPTPKGSTSCR